MTVDRTLSKDTDGTWGPSVGSDGDWSMDEGLDSVIQTLLGTDARAEEYEVPNEIDRRGYIGDEHALDEGYSLGGKLWLKEQSRNTQQTANEAVEYGRTSLSVLVPDFFKRVSIDGQRNADGITLNTTLERYDNKIDNVLYQIVDETGK
jgi:phage gp46-like protein